MLNEYFEKHSNLIKGNYDLLRLNYDAEAIHNFRLSLKRTKVVLQFLEVLTNSKITASENIKKYRPIFKKTGRIRDLQVQTDLYITLTDETNISDTSYIKYLANRESKSYKKLKSSFTDNDLFFLSEFNDLIVANTKNISDEDLVNTGNELAREKANRIKEIYSQDKSHIRFHAIRGILKDIYYLNNIVNTQLALQEILNIDHDRLNTLGSMFGAWHDKINALAFLKKFLAKNTDKKEVYDELVRSLDQKRAEEYLVLDEILHSELKIK